MEQNIENDIISIIKNDTKKNDQEAKNIYKSLQDNLNNDLTVIIKSTNLDLWSSYELYKKNNFNLINSLIEFEDPHYNQKKKNNNHITTYTEVEKKIIKLRQIADVKDEYYEQVIKNQ